MLTRVYQVLGKARHAFDLADELIALGDFGPRSPAIDYDFARRSFI